MIGKVFIYCVSAMFIYFAGFSLYFDFLDKPR